MFTRAKHYHVFCYGNTSFEANDEKIKNTIFLVQIAVHCQKKNLLNKSRKIKVNQKPYGFSSNMSTVANHLG